MVIFLEILTFRILKIFKLIDLEDKFFRKISTISKLRKTSGGKNIESDSQVIEVPPGVYENADYNTALQYLIPRTVDDIRQNEFPKMTRHSQFLGFN